jgi:cysteine-rich repeat protein
MTSLLLVSMGALGCGDNIEPFSRDGGAGGTADAGIEVDASLDPDGCQVLTLGRPDFQFNFFGQLTGLSYPIEPGLGGSGRDALLVELYDSTTEGLPPLVTGTFDLSEPPDDNLGTCQHCVWVVVDEVPDAPLGPIYYQTEGTLTLTSVVDPLWDPVFAGGTSRVVMRQATVGDDGHSELVPGGDCVAIDRTSFDTTPTPGRACLSAEDCGNALLEICAPGDNVCAPPQCGEFQGCPGADQICVTQYHELFEGACYTACDPGAASPPAACGDDQRCVQLGVDPTLGLCKSEGDGAAGDACEIEDNGTSCAGDAVCSAESATCTGTCDFFDTDSGCADGALCSLFGVCEPEASGVPVGLGATCGPGAELASACAADGEAFRGICFGYRPEDPLVCEAACLGELGCEAGEFCALRFSSGLGICLPLPVCGDGELGEINEVCDDGNTVSGDGCSGDCQTVEYDVICASLPELGVDATVGGDTAGGRDGFQGSCQFGIARAELFSVTPPGPGRLRLRVTSPTDHTLSLRGDCADPASELACAERAAAGETEELIVQVTDAQPAALTAMVSALTVLEQGPFTLTSDFVPEDCGDGIIAGAEVCDDGNVASDDGCRGDCREIEYDFYCAQAPALSTAAPTTGDTTGAPRLYDSTCSNPAGTGPDRLHRFTAPIAGQLRLRLQQGPNDLALTIYDGCGAPAEMTELGCSSVVDVEEVTVDLAAGQTITAVVDGFSADNQGPYQLDAAFTPD